MFSLYLIGFSCLGLVFGSFINVLVIRTHKKKSWIYGRSACPHCQHTLSWYELIPVVSYVIQRGRCRSCGAKLSWQYPLVELITAVIFGLLWWHFQPHTTSAWLTLGLWLLLSVPLLAATIYDARYMLLPDDFLLPCLALGLMLLGLAATHNLHQAIIQLASALGFTLFYFLLWYLSKGKFIGDGDIRLAFLMGLVLSWPLLLLAIFISYMIAASVAVVLIVRHQKSGADRIAFGPYLVIGLYSAILFGTPILAWYSGLLNLNL